MRSSIRYHFRQSFPFSAAKAYAWCTDFDAGDFALMGGNATRVVKRIADSTILLIDTFQTADGPVEKQKLVELYPDRFSWNATHLTGPNQHSQFLYEISAADKNASHIDFTALHLEKGNLSQAEAGLLAEKLCKEDAEAWRRLAQAMAKDLGK
jgi:hypothetical protein